MSLPLDPLPLEVVPFDFDGLKRMPAHELVLEAGQMLQKFPDVAVQAVEVVVAKARICPGPT